MRFWQSISRILVGAVLGLCLVMTLHACQTAEVTSVASTPIPSTSPDAAVPLTPSPTPLPPATQAIVDQVGNLDNPPRGQVRLAVISDLNSAYGSTDYEPEVDQGIALLPFWQPDLVVCGGDMIAGQNASLTTSEIQAMWAAFDQHIAAPLRQANLPLGFTIGNHDASGARSSDGQFLFQQERELATAYWNTPEHDPGVQFIDRTQFPFYYTFSFNDVFFLVWDGSSSQIPTEKLAWVEQALSSQQAQQAKLRILVGHLPLYGVAIGRDKPGEVMENADQLRMMLERYNVHTYISGHHHAYYPAHKGKMQLLHTGILGAGPRPLIAGDRPPQKTITIVDINFDTPDFTTYTTYDMQTLQPIAMEDLPRFLNGHNGRVLRRDVQPEELTTEEQSMCEQQLGSALCAA